MSVDRKLGRAGRREDDLPGPRQQAGGDLESRVLLADDEDAAVGIGLDRTQLAVVRDLGNSRNRGAKRLRHADREDQDRSAVFAVRRAKYEVAGAVLAGRLPSASVPDPQAGPSCEQGQPAFHLGAGRKVRAAIHDLGHDPAMHFLFCQEAVPVVALVLTRVAVETGEWLGPAQHPLEDRPAPEHAAGCLVLRKHRVLDAETAEAVGELQPARPTADDDERIAARRKGLRL